MFRVQCTLFARGQYYWTRIIGHTVLVFPFSSLLWNYNNAINVQCTVYSIRIYRKPCSRLVLWLDRKIMFARYSNWYPASDLIWYSVSWHNYNNWSSSISNRYWINLSSRYVSTGFLCNMHPTSAILAWLSIRI